MSSNPEYIDDHDIFRQQLPLPILKKGHQEMKDVSIFLIDTFDTQIKLYLKPSIM